MGTNYYLYKNVCSHCGRGDEPLHIGKSSAGWCFGLHVIPEDGINDLPDWEKLWNASGSYIKNEYGEVFSPAQMREIITERQWHCRTDPGNNWYKENHAEPGPNGLARSLIDGHCIGHGKGTWDLKIGEFS